MKTKSELHKFYEQDKEKYEIKKNKKFLDWFDNILKNGYKSYTSLDEIQKTIDTIVNWYEIKYPNEWILEHSNGEAKVLNEMDTKQLLSRMRKELIIPCYRSSGGGITHIRVNDEYKMVGTSFMPINIIDEEMKKRELDKCLSTYFLLAIYSDTGKVCYGWYLERYFHNDENTTIEDVLSLFEEKYSDKFEYDELKECVYNHECDIELRNKMLQLTALKMLYSGNTNPSDGYKRAKHFIEEFNEELGLNLSTNEIDKLYNKEYPEDDEITKKTSNKRKKIVNILNKKN